MTTPTAPDETSYELVRDLVIDLLNPPDDDAAEEAIVCDAVERAVTWIDQQPCLCPAGDDIDFDEVCGRCHALGRSQDEQVPR